MRLLAGIEQLSEGQIHRKRGMRLGYLAQDPSAEARSLSLWDSMLGAFAEVRRLEAEMTALAGCLGDGDDASTGELERYSTLQAELERRDGYTYEHRIETILHGLGFAPGQFHTPLERLSGGQRTRALLAQLLAADVQLLLLDEPTNYLDLQAVEWLEGWLRDFRGSLLVVSHDRFFLDSVCSRIWELAFGTLETYRGNYSAYARQRQERYERRLVEWRAQEQYVAKTEEFIRRFLAGQRTKEAQGRRKRLRRYLKQEAVDRPRRQKQIDVRLDTATRTGDIVMEIDLVAGFEPETPIVRAERLEIRRGQRIAVVGANGTGKTTLVRTLLRELPPLQGYLRHGAKVEIGYLPQAHDYLDGGKTVLDSVRDLDPETSLEEMRTFLGSFLFSDDDVLKTIDQLSGGERSRVALARLVVTGANVLVLDEPTNHLDIASQEILESVLADFSGTLLLVSHDRFLIQALADRIWWVGDGGVSDFEGGWVSFSEQRGTEAAETTAVGSTARQEQRELHREERRERKHRERLSRRHDELEGAIHDAEVALAELGEQIGRAGEDQNIERVQELTEQYTGPARSPEKHVG